MYVGKITINRKKYPAALTMRGVKEIGQRFGDMEGMNQILLGEGHTETEVMDALLGTTEILLTGGRDYLKANGKDAEEPPIDDLDILIGMEDISLLISDIYTTINGSSEREVTVESDPNAKTTQSE